MKCSSGHFLISHLGKYLCCRQGQLPRADGGGVRFINSALQCIVLTMISIFLTVLLFMTRVVHRSLLGPLCGMEWIVIDVYLIWRLPREGRRRGLKHVHQVFHTTSNCGHARCAIPSGCRGAVQSATSAVVRISCCGCGCGDFKCSLKDLAQ